MGVVIFIIFLGAIAFGGYAFYQKMDSGMPEKLKGGWVFHYPNVELSAMDVYTAIEEAFEPKKMPEVSFSRVEFSEHGEVMDRHRIYLRIRHRMYVYDICVAPYANGFFISGHYGEDIPFVKWFLVHLPLIGGYIENRLLSKTYYTADTNAVFERIAETTVNEAIDGYLSQKGARALTPEESKSRRMRKEK